LRGVVAPGRFFYLGGKADAKLKPVIPENPTDPLASVAPEPVEPIVAEPGVAEPVAETVPEETVPEEPGERPRSTLAEWMITVLLLLFLTTTLVQAFVIPTGSMEDTLLVGDHLLVDKLAYAPSGPVSKYLLPYTEPKRGDIIVFRYPVDISQTYVKRCMGVPGDRIRVINKQVYLNGVKLDEAGYVVHKTDYIDSYRDNFSGRAERDDRTRGARNVAEKCGQRGGGGASGHVLRDGR